MALVPFIVTGSARSGSSLILLTLGRHPAILAAGELFHPDPTQREQNHAVRAGGSAQAFDPDAEDAVRFVERTVWSPRRGIAAAGFKMFVYHETTRGADGLLSRLAREHPDLRVIHARRRNYLDMWVSLKKAEITGLWAATSRASGPELDPIAADAPQLQNYFEAIEAADDRVASLVSPDRYLAVDYERLSANYEEAVSSVFDFLGVEAKLGPPPLAKQNRQPHSHFLANYAQLADHFAGSRFSWFF